jgi:NAD(P)-dependent dehydrogenase (short-subunit alcohol dehydrogenase family)
MTGPRDTSGATLAGRRVLVTGAARGIGRAAALAASEAGASVAVCDVLDAELAVTAAQIGARGTPAFSALCDVTDAGAVERTVAAAQAALGGIDTLVNSAGVLAVGRLGELTDETWARVLDVNLGGTMRMTRAVLPAMLEAGAGSIVQIASITPIKGEARTAAYSASKGGVIGLTRSLSAEVARSGVRVNAVAPGFILTDQTAEVFVGETGDWVRRQVPAGRLGTPEDVAGMVVYLASDASRYVTGQVLSVDGGVT